MIKRYSDHAANERTFLAWVRTAIAVMAFGFLIERFDLFMKFAVPQAAQQQIAPHGQALCQCGRARLHRHRRGDDRGSGFRFVKTAKDIEATTTCQAPANASISHSPYCSVCWAGRCFSICRGRCCCHSEDDLEKACPGLESGWASDFGKDHAQAKCWSPVLVQAEAIGL